MEEKSIKTHIKKTFLEIYKEKPVELIKVNEIISKAHIGRSTFYKYYKNVYDVLKTAEQEVVVEVKNLVSNKKTVENTSSYEEILNQELYELYRYVVNNRNFFEGAFSTHGNYLFKREIKNFLVKKIDEEYSRYFDNKETRDAFNDYASSLIGYTSSILLRNNDAFDIKAISIKTQKTILDLVNNQNIYFKKDGK